MRSLSLSCCTILVLSYLPAAGEERQLYRSFSLDPPSRGYLLGPLNGASEQANFETCDGEKKLVDIKFLEKMPGNCEGSHDRGPLEASKDFVGAVVFMAGEQKELGTVTSVATDPSSGDISSISGETKAGAKFTYGADKLDLQRTERGPQVLVVE